MLNRSDLVLKYIVEYFIKHAQPVGSQTLIDEYGLEFSSATIRNEMFALEKMGLIEKPHTSAGRIPSTKGYKYYCEHLRDKTLNEEIKYSIQSVLESKVQSVEQIIKESCEIISHMTSLVSVVVGPDEKEEKLASIQLIKISPKSLTAVFVTDKGYVENKTFIIPDTLSTDEIIDCVKLLNERLVGTPVSDLVNKIEAIKPILSEYIISHSVIYQAMVEAFVKFASDRLAMYGGEELLNHPEFQNDSNKLLKVLRLLNNSSSYRMNDGEEISDGDVNIRIGEDAGNPDISMVSKKINIGGDETNICLVGPKRMDYDSAMSALEYLQEALNEYFNKGGNNDA